MGVFDFDGFGFDVKIPGEFPPPMPKIIENGLLPDGDVAYEFAATEWSTAMIVLPTHNRYGERTGLQALRSRQPLWTRHMLGVQEGARDRRRRRR